jgi:hypothetical protein
MSSLQSTATKLNFGGLYSISDGWGLWKKDFGFWNSVNDIDGPFDNVGATTTASTDLVVYVCDSHSADYVVVMSHGSLFEVNYTALKKVA